MRLVAWDWPRASLRLAGWLIGILCGAVLARLHIASSLGLPAGPGGMVGSWLVHVGMPLLNWVGLTLMALVGLFIGRADRHRIFVARPRRTHRQAGFDGCRVS